MFVPLLRNKENIGKNADDIAMLKKICKELEQKSLQEEEKLSALHIEVENIQMNMSLNHRTVIQITDDRTSIGFLPNPIASLTNQSFFCYSQGDRR